MGDGRVTCPLLGPEIHRPQGGLLQKNAWLAIAGAIHSSRGQIHVEGETPHTQTGYHPAKRIVRTRSKQHAEAQGRLGSIRFKSKPRACSLPSKSW